MTDDAKPGLEAAVPLQGLLGYVNFAEGKLDPRFQKQVNDAFAFFAEQGSGKPWEDLFHGLKAGLDSLHQGGGAFRDVGQARAVLELVFLHVLPAYRAHHADLLVHQGEADLWQPFFLARVFEAVLAQRGPWDQTDRIVRGTLRQLNDYVGFRPVAVLETRQRGEPYDHERVRPIPLFLRGAGVAWGTFQPLAYKTLDLLRATDPALLADACFDLDNLDELALDPRGYDFNHPVDKRPNYCFGEWDPHHIDTKGNYRRFVVRQVTLDGLWQRVQGAEPERRDEYLFEAAAVLACTILMAAGVSGAGPTTFDSSVNLSGLIPRIARNREAFYAQVLDKVDGPHGQRLREEMKLTRQPFGGARQHLNHFLGQRRARQLQQRHLALLLADMGYPAAARRQVTDMDVASLRMLTEMHLLLSAGHLRIDQGRLEAAAQTLPRVEDLLRRGIACGALADPWNILGFQGQFPRFAALEDSMRDPRIEALLRVVERLFNLYARLMSEGAAAGTFTPDAGLAKDMRCLADWWDRFATTTVSDIPHVHGGAATESAERVAQALGRWRERGAAAADLGFWREHLEGFQAPKAFALVVDALLRRQDFRAAMALLMTWLSQVDQVPLEEGEFSFHHLALRWMLGVCTLAKPLPDGRGSDPRPSEPRPSEPRPSGSGTPSALVAKFFDYLEANAEDYALVPRLDLLGTGQEDAPQDKEVEEKEEESLFGAAYEDMTYRDSTDDDVEAEVLDFMPQKDFDLAGEAERLEKRLRFLATLAKLWNIGTRALRETRGGERKGSQEALHTWLGRARKNYLGLLELLDAIHDHDIPKPSGAYDSLVEFDNRRVVKERLLGLVITTCLDQALAVGALRGGLERDIVEKEAGPSWEPYVIRLERALLQKEPALARSWLPEFIRRFRNEPLLYTPMTHGGHSRQILRASIAQTILRGLVANLPRQGLLRETYHLVLLAHAMEQGQQISGPRVTEFDRLFQLAVQAVAEAVLEAGLRDAVPPERVVAVLENVTEPFLGVWMEHAKTLRVAMLEAITSEKDWARLGDFIKQYGHDLFHVRFMTLANLRGILHRGVGPYLDYLAENPDPLKPVRLIDDLERGIPRDHAERCLQIILQTLIENYDHFRDYNTTTTQSDYGENLYQLFDFLRLKASYERNAWQLRPLNLVHEVLARNHGPAVKLWRDQVEHLCRQTAEDHLRELARLEKMHGMRLTTIADRLEERFVKPMALDELCAQIEPALDQAPKMLDEVGPIPLEEALRPFTATPTGVGLDVPHWILRLEGEVLRVRTSRTALVNLAETLFQVPKLPIPFEELAGQLKDWKKAGN